MIKASMFPAYRSFSLILICAMLGACATTQKSSTGSGQQDAAPISEASQPQATAKSGETANPPAAGRASVAAAPNPGTKNAAAASAAQPMPESTAASRSAEEAAQLKRQLADQDAQINKLRGDQQVEAARVEEAAQEKEAESAMQPDQPAPATETERPASPVPATKPQDEIAVFPSNSDAGAGGAGQPAVERSVYFGYDQATVADKYEAMLMANAAYLKAHPNVTAEVQGNCDERGSREYNLALGARRAESVKRALELAGAEGKRISAISFGAEKPVATGKDEESYSKNRRADIVY